MKTFIAYTCVFILIYTGLLSNAAAQNLVPNPSFEAYTQCPIGYGPGGPLDAPPWLSATDGTIDYFHPCSNPSVVGVPDNAFGSQSARTGLAYAGGFFSYDLSEYREYLLVELTQPLQAGKTYSVGFFVSLAGLGCGIESIGVLFTPDLPMSPGSGAMDYIPQIENDMGYISDTTNWVLIQDCYTAAGGEVYMTIGNFRNFLDTSFDPLCPNWTATAYYYIDDVSVIEVPTGDILFDLGADVQVCDSFQITPGIENVNYFWQDGSSDTSLTVTTSGTYSLTVYNGCQSGTDDIDITVNNPPPVSLGPDQVTICTGDAYTLSLDPDYGEYTWNDGSDDPVYTITMSGLYSVTLDDGCDLTTAEVNVMTMDAPEPFTLGPDTVLCPGAEIEFSFDPTLGEFEWQDNSAEPVYTISNGGIYAVTISNSCGEEFDEIEVISGMTPFVDLGPDEEEVCLGDDVDVVFSLDPGIGQYAWQDGNISAFYHITSTGLYSVTVSNQCGMAADTFEIIEVNPPVVDFDETTSLCPGDTIILHAHGQPGNYLWQDQSVETEFLVTSPGEYALTVSNQCGAGSDTILIHHPEPLQVPGLGPDINLCPGDMAILMAGDPVLSYTWQDMSTADTFVVHAAGTYHVVISDGCQSVADTIEVTAENIPPEISLPDQLLLCQGNAEVLDPGLSGVTYAWSDGSANPTFLVDVAGTYALTVTNGCGTDADTVLVLDGGPAPVVSLGPDISVCPGEQINIIPFSSNVNTWLWPDGSTLESYMPASAGLVYIEAANHCGMAYDTMVVTLLPVTPDLTLGPDIQLCPGETVNLSVMVPDVAILWSDGSEGNMFIATEDDTEIYASITNGCGVSSDTVNVTVLPAAPSLDLGQDQALCPGEVITIDPGLDNVSYLWQDGTTHPLFQTTQEVTVILSVTNTCGTSTDTMQITESTDSPQLELGPDLHGCEGVALIVPAGISGVSYQWHDGSEEDEYVATLSGWVHLMVSNMCGTDTDSLYVDLSGVTPAPDLGPDTVLCEGQMLILFADSVGSSTILWQDGSAGQQFIVQAPGVYTLTETNACGVGTDHITVTHLHVPAPFSLGPDTAICPGTSVMLFAPQGEGELIWQDGSDQPFFFADQPQIYSLQISNACGVAYDSVVVTTYPEMPYINLVAGKRWCPGDEIVLNAAQPFHATYLWNTGEESASIVVEAPGVYSVEVVGPCVTAFGQVEVIPMRDCSGDDEVYIPNVFSPNGDQFNDVFTLSFGNDLQLISLEGAIYDRWGNQVYSSDKTSFTWDGRLGDSYVLPGVFVYHISIRRMLEGEEVVEVYHGDVTVIR